MKPSVKVWDDEVKGKVRARAIRQKAMAVANAYWVAQGKPSYGVNGNMALECLKALPESQEGAVIGRFFYQNAPGYQRGTFVREWNILYRKTLYAKPGQVARPRTPAQDDMVNPLADAIIDIHNSLANKGAKAWAVTGAQAIGWAEYLQECHKGGPCDTFLRKADAKWRDALATEWDKWAEKKRIEHEQRGHYPEIDKARRGREMAATLKPFFDWLEAMDYSLARMNEDGEARPIKLSLEALTDLCWQYLGFDVTKLISEMDSLVARIGQREGEQ